MQVPGSNLGPLLNYYNSSNGAYGQYSGVQYNGPIGGYGGPNAPVGYTNAANMSLCVLAGQYIPPFIGNVSANGVNYTVGAFGKWTNVTSDYAYQLSFQGTEKAMPGDTSGPYMPGACAAINFATVCAESSFKASSPSCPILSQMPPSFPGSSKCSRMLSSPGSHSSSPSSPNLTPPHHSSLSHS